jgi:hypothetical protein
MCEWRLLLLLKRTMWHPRRTQFAFESKQPNRATQCAQPPTTHRNASCVIDSITINNEERYGFRGAIVDGIGGAQRDADLDFHRIDVSADVVYRYAHIIAGANCYSHQDPHVARFEDDLSPGGCNAHARCYADIKCCYDADTVPGDRNAITGDFNDGDATAQGHAHCYRNENNTTDIDHHHEQQLFADRFDSRTLSFTHSDRDAQRSSCTQHRHTQSHDH